MGFDYYALAHHVDLRTTGAEPVLLHNCPESWADLYQEEELGPIDPVRRMSVHGSPVPPWWGGLILLGRQGPAPHVQGRSRSHTDDLDLLSPAHFRRWDPIWSSSGGDADVPAFAGNKVPYESLTSRVARLHFKVPGERDTGFL
ncbi:autoinducer binding domain-containing protein [Sphingobium herbicidovorans]|uniref:autoinducer binding domain-containing protein n=1 Tax=Sphingobium herbicidovorans TaxID=76947 RepID=UPI003899A717